MTRLWPTKVIILIRFRRWIRMFFYLHFGWNGIFSLPFLARSYFRVLSHRIGRAFKRPYFLVRFIQIDQGQSKDLRSTESKGIRIKMILIAFPCGYMAVRVAFHAPSLVHFIFGYFFFFPKHLFCFFRSFSISRFQIGIDLLSGVKNMSVFNKYRAPSYFMRISDIARVSKRVKEKENVCVAEESMSCPHLDPINSSVVATFSHLF